MEEFPRFNIVSLKQTAHGYIVNGNISVPAVEDNMDYQYILKFLADNPTFPIEPGFTLNDLKSQKLDYIRQKFEETFKTGKFTSSLGFETDCRRYGQYLDKDNLESLIKIGSYPIYWMDANGQFHALTSTDAQTLLTEMIQFGLSQYQKKWALENAIAAAQNEQDLSVIEW